MNSNFKSIDFHDLSFFIIQCEKFDGSSNFNSNKIKKNVRNV
jgi:hypothetical protein